jgi:tetratricopeptide (TPR) repeat protein
MDLARFSAGSLDAAATSRMMAHLTRCGECGARLKLITSAGEEHLSPEELACIETLPSSTPAGRAALAKRMMAERRTFGPALRIAAAVAGVGILLGGIWFVRQRRVQPDALVAGAYSSRRPFSYRLSAGGSPRPVEIQRSSSNLTELPPNLVNALATVEEEVANRPNDPALLSAAGQAKLLALNVNEAVEVLEQAHRLNLQDASITTNLATALALKSGWAEPLGPSGNVPDAVVPISPLLLRSLELLDEVLRQRPSDTVARFNRALVLKKLGRNADAAAEFRRCLEDERDSAWRAEIAAQIKALD